MINSYKYLVKINIIRVSLASSDFYFLFFLIFCNISIETRNSHYTSPRPITRMEVPPASKLSIHTTLITCNIAQLKINNMITLKQFVAYCKRHNINSVVISASFLMHNDECLGESIKLSQDDPNSYESYREDMLTYDTIRMLSPADAYDELRYAFSTPDDLVKAHMRSLMPKRAVFSNDLDELPF